MNEEGFTSFLCPSCRTEIEASPDLIGQETECPACGEKLTVPDCRDAGARRHGMGESPDARARQAMKSRTIRIELGDL